MFNKLEFIELKCRRTTNKTLSDLKNKPQINTSVDAVLTYGFIFKENYLSNLDCRSVLGAGGGGASTSNGKSSTVWVIVSDVFLRSSSFCLRSSQLLRLSSTFSVRKRWTSLYLFEPRRKLKEGDAIVTKKLAMNRPAANVRKNGKILLNNPLYIL